MIISYKRNKYEGTRRTNADPMFVSDRGCNDQKKDPQGVFF